MESQLLKWPHLRVPNRDPESSPPVAPSEVRCDESEQDGSNGIGQGPERVPPWLGNTTCSARGNTAVPHQFCQNRFAIALDPGRMRTLTSTCPGGGAVAITLPAPSTSCRKGKANSSHTDEPSLVTVKSVALSCAGESLVEATPARNESELQGGGPGEASG